MKTKILCIGSVLQEIIYNTDNADILTQFQGGGKNKYIAFDFGSKISSNEVWRSFGGGAMNSSMNFKSFGLNATPLSLVGDDLMGHAIVRYLSKAGISTKLIKITKRANTAFSFILNLPKAAEHIIFVSQGVLPGFKFGDYNLLKHSSDYLYLTSIRGPYANFNLRSIFNYARIKNLNIFWNPGQQQIDNLKQYIMFLGRVSIFSINMSEAKDISKVLRIGSYSTAKLANKLLELGCDHVIITNGSKGVYYFDKTDKYKLVAKKVAVRNTTGAGDAFNSGFLGAYILKKDVRTALDFGMRNAVSVLQTMGAHEGSLKKKDI